VTPKHLCLFCDAPADSLEDVLPVWSQEKLKGRLPILVSGFSGDRPIPLQGMRSNLRTRCVCKKCNMGWMSHLEGETRRIIGPLMEDVHFGFDADQQSTIVKWAIKTAMTGESFNRRNRKLFYTRDECAKFRQSWQIPPHTLVWIGRYTGVFNLGIFGIDGWDKHPKEPGVTQAYTTTVTLGRVVMQVVSLHVARHLYKGTVNINAEHGPWEHALLDLRPSNRGLFWPPPLSFSDKGTPTLRSLVERFRVGALPARPLRPGA